MIGNLSRYYNGLSLSLHQSPLRVLHWLWLSLKYKVFPLDSSVLGPIAQDWRRNSLTISNLPNLQETETIHYLLIPFAAIQGAVHGSGRSIDNQVAVSSRREQFGSRVPGAKYHPRCFYTLLDSIPWVRIRELNLSVGGGSEVCQSIASTSVP